MPSTFMGIEIGRRGVAAHSLGLSTIGHNIANAATEGYSRQRVELGASDPIYAPELNREDSPGQLGQGVATLRVERLRDEVVEGRIVAQTGTAGYWETRDKYALMLEQVHNEPSEISVRGAMDKFWDSWQELAAAPQETAARRAVVERGQSLIDGIHERYRQLTRIRDAVEGDIEGTVQQVNSIASQIAELNGEIARVKALGDMPNDLMDRRDLLVEKLGKLVPITTGSRDADEFMVHLGGRVLIQGRAARGLELVSGPANEGLGRLVWSDTGSEAAPEGGALGALFELRDVDIRGEIQGLDTMTLSFVDLVNETHRRGYGLNGSTGLDFFREFPGINNVAGNFDRDGDGAYDASYVYRLTGANALDPKEPLGLAGTMRLSGPGGDVSIEYRATDTVSDVVNRINASGAEVTARITPEGRLQLRATPAADPSNPDFVIRHVEDSGHFLAGYAGILSSSGPEGAFDFGRPDAVVDLRAGGDYAVAPVTHPAGWIEVSASVAKDLNNLAAGFGENGRPAAPGDGSAALAIASLRTGAVMVGPARTFDDYFADAVARAGLRGEEAGRATETQERIVKQLRDTRDSLSGVNIDEELSAMIKFQHGFAAAAKFIAQMDEMLDTIINRMGV